ncbi:MAG: hypothetical protein KDE51_26005 [Anaerolineales bacterium]|nr:hypothetical protein [Anaerolineales bacterium]
MRCLIYFLLSAVFALAGCAFVPSSATAVPTLQPTAALPTPLSVAAVITATQVLDTAVVTATVAPTPTPPPPTATPVIEANIDITGPQTDGSYQLGEPLRVSGRGAAYPGHFIEVIVLSLDQRIITAAPTQLNELNTWQVALDLPTNIAGSAIIKANLFSAEGELLDSDQVRAFLTVTTDDERYLVLERPFGQVTAVAGYNLFFDGLAENPTNYVIRIAIKNGPNCQEVVTEQSYTLRGSGYWQAFVLIPEAAAGPACAMTYFGEEGSENRREVQLPVNILPRTDPNAYAVFLSYPPSGSNARAGQRIELYGTAYNAPNNELQITLLLDDGTLAASDIVAVDRAGYWEHTLLLPVDVLGETQLTVAIGRDGDILAQQTIFLTLVE